jgi:hypothetical protein
LDWAENIEEPPPSEKVPFLWSLHTACALDTVKYFTGAGKQNKRKKKGPIVQKEASTAGIVSWLPQAYRNHLENKDKALKPDMLLGEPGRTIVFRGSLEEKRPLSFNVLNQGQTKNISEVYCIAKSQEYSDKIAVWVGDAASIQGNVGDTIAIKAKIQGHTYIREVPATILTQVEPIDSTVYEENKQAAEQQMQEFIDSQKNPVPPQNAPVPAAVAQPGAKNVYTNGQVVNALSLTITRCFPTKSKGSYYAEFKDDTGAYLKTFLRQSFSVGDKINVSGTIAIEPYNGRDYTVIKNPKVIVNAPGTITPTPAPVQVQTGQPWTPPAAPTPAPVPGTPGVVASGGWYQRLKKFFGTK